MWLLLHPNNNKVIGRKKMTKEKTKKEFEERQPRLERSIKLSKDGNWLILKTIRTDIVHINYLKKVLNPGE
jgi:hypothetical protein